MMATASSASESAPAGSFRAERTWAWAMRQAAWDAKSSSAEKPRLAVAIALRFIELGLITEREGEQSQVGRVEPRFAHRRELFRTRAEDRLRRLRATEEPLRLADRLLVRQEQLGLPRFSPELVGTPRLRAALLGSSLHRQQPRPRCREHSPHDETVANELERLPDQVDRGIGPRGSEVAARVE